MKATGEQVRKMEVAGEWDTRNGIGERVGHSTGEKSGKVD